MKQHLRLVAMVRYRQHAAAFNGCMLVAGEHGNAELVNKYGFALPDNPFDTVKLDKQCLVALANQHEGGGKACKKRCKFLNDHR